MSAGAEPEAQELSALPTESAEAEVRRHEQPEYGSPKGDGNRNHGDVTER
jgi:hypothetical protein